MISIQKAMIFLLLGFFVTPVYGQWKIYKRADLQNKEGHTLRIDGYSGGGAVRAWLILKKEFPGVFGSKLPLYQIDNNTIHDIQSFEVKRIQEDRWIYWQIYDGTRELSGELLEFKNGKKAVFQYYLPDGTIKETVFLLDGAEEAIDEVLEN